MPDKSHASVRRVSTNSMMKPRPSSALDKARKARITALQTEEQNSKELISPERSKSSKNLFATEEILTKVIQRPTKKFSLFITGILYVSAVSGTSYYYSTALCLQYGNLQFISLVLQPDLQLIALILNVIQISWE